ncbi:unnamed protein product [Thelazia callipaeda]|uniref:Gamma-tubulin complex component n=1 Tax=Thelazia callipaeda TaxID=103827 RepID=A0A0N5D0L2_THECL|nr:unnamed protein product [Thelazia callipaeda]
MVPRNDYLMYTRCESEVQTIAALAKCVVKLLDARDRSKLHRFSNSDQRILYYFVNNPLLYSGINNSQRLEMKNVKQLRMICDYYNKVDKVNKFMQSVSTLNTKFLRNVYLSIESHVERLKTLDITSLLFVSIFLLFQQKIKGKSISLMSPHFLSIIPDRGDQNHRILSPTIFSFQREGLLSLHDLYEHYLLELILELSGAAQAVQKIIDTTEGSRKEMENIVYPTVLKLIALQKNWEEALNSYSGFLNFLLQVHFCKQKSTTKFLRSFHNFRTTTTSILSPTALTATILSPTAFGIDVLSPRALSALVLSPRALITAVLSPHLIHSRVLSPETLIIEVLTPDILSPSVGSGGSYSIHVLSPKVLSPQIWSKNSMILEVK